MVNTDLLHATPSSDLLLEWQQSIVFWKNTLKSTCLWEGTSRHQHTRHIAKEFPLWYRFALDNVSSRHTKLKSNLLTFAHLSMAGRFLPTQSYRPMRALSWYEMPWRQGQIYLPPHIPLSLFLLLNLDVGVQRLDRRLLSPLAVVNAEVLRSIDHDAVRIKRCPPPTVSRTGCFIEVVLFASFDIGPENINIQVTVWSWLLMNGS